MGPSPAAAAFAGPRTGRAGIPERLESLLRGSCPGTGRDLAARLLPALSPPRPPAAPVAEPEFSWLRVPRWLASAFGLDATAAGGALLDDLCWLQFCVYGVFRIQDDLVDGACAEPALAVQANALLVEAARCATRHFDGGSPFWTVFQEGIDSTSRAVLTLNELQRSPGRDPAEELRLYAELSASLKIAAAGVALAASRDAEWRDKLSPALDGFAVAGQIVDDLRDIREDLAAGCINHAAWFLSHPIFSTAPEAVAAVVASNLATTDRLDRLLERAGAAMDRPLARLERELCPPVHDYLLDYRRGLVGLGARIQGSRSVVLAGSAQNR